MNGLCVRTSGAAPTLKEDRFTRELVPVSVKVGQEIRSVTIDEHPRADASMEGLAKLTPLPVKLDAEATVTAGNASGKNGGASACIVTTPERARALGLAHRSTATAERFPNAPEDLHEKLAGVGTCIRRRAQRPSALLRYLCLLLCAVAAPALAKPVAFQGGTVIVAEYGAGMMTEVQVFHAPSYRWSAGVGHVRLEADDDSFTRDITYLRGNVLLNRWNRPHSQANAVAWGGVGEADSSGDQRQQAALNAGGQLDYETLRFYSSLRTDWQYSMGNFSHRIDTAQLGWAPYPHEWNSVATWFVVQGRNFTGGLYDGIEGAALIRLFRNGRKFALWIEAGVTQDGRLQSMLMVNF